MQNNDMKHNIGIFSITLSPRLTVHATLSGFLRIWAFRNDEKSDPLNGACTDTWVSVHALLRGGTFMRAK